MSATSKQPVNALDRPTQVSATRSNVQSVETFASQTRPVSAEVPIGVMEVPVSVWGSRPVVSTSSQPGRVDLFAEETCTVIVFPHGAVIRLAAPIAPGQMMMVTNRNSLKVVPCRVVNVRNFPNVRGYAEIAFLQSVNGFWGPYTPHGTLNLTARIPSTAQEKLPKPGPDAPRPSSSQARILTPSATSLKPPLVASTPTEDSLSSSFPNEAISIFANAATASPAPPRLSGTKLSQSKIVQSGLPSLRSQCSARPWRQPPLNRDLTRRSETFLSRILLFLLLSRIQASSPCHWHRNISGTSPQASRLRVLGIGGCGAHCRDK